MTDDIISTAEAAEIIGVSVRRVVALCNGGKLPAQQVGRSWVIRRRDAENFQRGDVGWPKGRPRSAPTD